MTKTQIEVYVRAKPTVQPSSYVRIDPETGCIFYHFPSDVANVYINNQKTDYNFKFTKTFQSNVEQDQVFKTVAQNAVLRYRYCTKKFVIELVQLTDTMLPSSLMVKQVVARHIP